MRRFGEFDESMTIDELCLWLESKGMSKEDQIIFRGVHVLNSTMINIMILTEKKINGIALKLINEEHFKNFKVSEFGMSIVRDLKTVGFFGQNTQIFYLKLYTDYCSSRRHEENKIK